MAKTIVVPRCAGMPNPTRPADIFKKKPITPKKHK